MNKQVKVGDRIEMRESYEAMGVKIGDKGTVIFVDNDGTFLAEFDRKINGHSGDGRGKNPHCCWLNFGRNFVIIDENHTEQKIVITADGNVTLARMYDGKTVIKSATAKCSPDDKFDFATGARIAFDRLIGQEKAEQEEKKPQHYNGKVVCAKRGYKCYCPVNGLTAGKIYTVIDGKIVDFDNGYKSTVYADSLEHLCCYMGHEFVPLVE